MSIIDSLTDKKNKKKTSVKKELKKAKKADALEEKTKVQKKSDIMPWITEKATLLNEQGVYVFKIAKKLNKKTVAIAIEKAYKVVPEKVNIVNIPSKKILLRRKHAEKPGYKKAVVFLKEGDKIEIA